MTLSYIVDDYCAGVEFDHPKKSGDQGGLASPCPPHNAHLGVGGGNVNIATRLC